MPGSPQGGIAGSGLGISGISGVDDAALLA